MSTESRLQLVGTEDEAPKGTQFASDILLLALKALSQRALTAIASLFTLLTVISAFWLALQVAVNPTIYQLIVLGLYLVFIGAINLIVRR